MDTSPWTFSVLQMLEKLNCARNKKSAIDIGMEIHTWTLPHPHFCLKEDILAAGSDIAWIVEPGEVNVG